MAFLQSRVQYLSTSPDRNVDYGHSGIASDVLSPPDSDNLKVSFTNTTTATDHEQARLESYRHSDLASDVLATSNLADTTSNKAMSSSSIAETPRTSVLMELTDRVGVLHDVLRLFWKYDINVSRIESRPVKIGSAGRLFDFFIDL